MAKTRKKTETKPVDIKRKSSTIVTFLLDRSASMRSCKAATIEGFNGYVSSLKEEQETAIDFTFLTFDDISLDKICVAEPIGEVALLTDAFYQPRGSTPLIDAAVKTIKATADALKTSQSRPASDDPDAARFSGLDIDREKPRIVVCIQTDGEENCSREYSWDQLQALVAEKTKEGWEFLFMGAGIDAYQQGARMGISGLNTVSYNQNDGRATRSVFAAASRNTRGFAAGRIGSASFSNAQRDASGDQFYQSYGLSGDQAKADIQKAMAKQQFSQPTTTRKSKVVDDFSL